MSRKRRKSKKSKKSMNNKITVFTVCANSHARGVVGTSSQNDELGAVLKSNISSLKDIADTQFMDILKLD